MSDTTPQPETPAEVAADATEWELEGDDSGDELDPDSPEVLAARRAAGDPTAPEEA